MRTMVLDLKKAPYVYGWVDKHTFMVDIPCQDDKTDDGEVLSARLEVMLKNEGEGLWYTYITEDPETGYAESKSMSREELYNYELEYIDNVLTEALGL